MMTNQERLQSYGYLHPQIPNDQVINTLSDALAISFSPHERVILRREIKAPDTHDFNQAMDLWVRSSLKHPDWQLAQRLLPLLLSRLEGHLNPRRID